VKPRLHLPTTVSLLAVVVLVCALPVAAQRVSVADRVAILEQRAADASTAASHANIEIINQINALRSEMRELRGQLEALQEQNEHLKSTLRSPLLDMDERLQALERAAREAASVAIEEHDRTQVADATPPAARGAALVAAVPVEVTPEDASDAAELAPDPAEERARYEAAFDALKSGRYIEAIRLFQAFLREFPEGVHAANAYYWLGESYYVVDDYAKAQAQFEALIARWPNHDKTPGALLKVGLSQYGQQQHDAAEATLGEVTQRYPGTDAAKTAADRLRAIRVSRLN